MCSWEDKRIPQIIKTKSWIIRRFSPENISINLILPAMCTLKQRTSSNLLYSFHLEAGFWSQGKKQIPWTSWSSTMKFPSSWDIFHGFSRKHPPPQKKKTNTGSHSLSCESTWQLSLSLSESERPLNYCSTKIIKSWAAYCISSQDAIQATEKKPLTCKLYWLFYAGSLQWLMIIPNKTG